MIPPQYASPNLYGTLWANYTLGFQAKITGGGIGWQVLNSGMYGLQFEVGVVGTRQLQYSNYFWPSSTEHTLGYFMALALRMALREVPLALSATLLRP